MSSRDAGGEPIDAPDAPDYDEPPEQGLDEGRVTREAWRAWPLWAKLRFLRRLRTEGCGRPEQYIDDSLAWFIWVLLGGRGSGKSDESSRWSAEETLRMVLRFALVARTFGDVRDTMFEGETGLLAVIPDSELKGGSRERAYNRSLGELFLANGSKFKGFSSEKASQLRGPQHHRAWLDEASSWSDADDGNVVDTTISNLMLGLRLKPPDGSGARMVVATTPKPNALTEFLAETAEAKGQIRVLTTYSNLSNLDEAVADIIVGMYEGTDVGAQELEGKILSQARGAAWNQAMLAAARDLEPGGDGGESRKAVVGVDPSVTSGSLSDETGLVAVARVDALTADGQSDPWLDVMADWSGVIDVGRFPTSVLSMAEEFGADEVCVEVNNGYDFVVNALVKHVEAEGGLVVRRVRKDQGSVRTKNRQVVEYLLELPSGHSCVLKPVWQSADKLTRAKAASVWWHRGRARHAHGLDALEKQMATFDGTGKRSPDRLDALTTAVAAFAGQLRRRPASPADPLHMSEAPPAGGPRHPLLGEAAGVGGGYAARI